MLFHLMLIIENGEYMRTCMKTNANYLSEYSYWSSTCGVWNTKLRKVDWR